MDTPKARNLMDQYFDRFAQILGRASPERLRQCGPGGKFIPLSTRIRFLMQDIIDLRKNRWRPLFEGQLVDRDHPWLLADLQREIDRVCYLSNLIILRFFNLLRQCLLVNATRESLLDDSSTLN